MVALLDERMNDGSRKFGEVPQRVLWDEMRDHLLRLPGATLTAFISDGLTEAWIDFTLGGHAFSVNDQLPSPAYGQGVYVPLNVGVSGTCAPLALIASAGIVPDPYVPLTVPL